MTSFLCNADQSPDYKIDNNFRFNEIVNLLGHENINRSRSLNELEEITESSKNHQMKPI